MIYDNININKNNIVEPENTFKVNFIKGATVEVLGGKEGSYNIKFINNRTGEVPYETTIRNNMWTRCVMEYFIEWRIEVYENGKLWRTYTYNAENKRVYIAFDSKALGDTMSWIPYIDEFRKKHNCQVVCSTFMNDLFVNEYTEIEFVAPGTGVDNLYAMYCLGLFYKDDGSVDLYKNPTDPKTQPMQKMCTDLLGLTYREIKPKIKHSKVEKPANKQVTIAIHGTAQTKYWNNPTGWQDVVDWLKSKGYEVKLVSREGDGYMGNSHPKGVTQLANGPIGGVIDEMLKSEAFIGIGSGLSWLSWGLGVKTVLISGFSYKWAEMRDCVRIAAPKGKCEGCFNRIKLDGGDWNWCPDHKGTDRQFECTKTITSEMVITELQKFL